MIQAIFFDLDGTLLDSEKRVPASALRALRRCRERGVRLFVATARPPILEKMLDWSEAGPLFDGGVYCNGACTVLDGRKEYQRIPPDVVRDVLARTRESDGLNVSLQMTEELQAFRLPLADAAWALWGLRPEEASPIDAQALERTVKMLIFYENLVDSVTELPPELVEALRQSCDGRARMYVTDNGRAIQLNSLAAGKYAGVERIRRALGLSREEVAVFGDDVNDLEMLRGYPHAVAMGNAATEIRAQAPLVTRSNDNGGIDWGIREVLDIR